MVGSYLKQLGSLSSQKLHIPDGPLPRSHDRLTILRRRTYRGIYERGNLSCDTFFVVIFSGTCQSRDRSRLLVKKNIYI